MSISSFRNDHSILPEDKAKSLGNIKLTIGGTELITIWVPEQKPKGMSSKTHTLLLDILEGLENGKSPQALANLIQITHWINPQEPEQDENFSLQGWK